MVRPSIRFLDELREYRPDEPDEQQADVKLSDALAGFHPLVRSDGTRYYRISMGERQFEAVVASLRAAGL